jgi:hypothetical protein
VSRAAVIHSTFGTAVPAVSFFVQLPGVSDRAIPKKSKKFLNLPFYFCFVTVGVMMTIAY